MKTTLLILIFLFSSKSMAEPKSKLFKKMKAYMPTLSEVGFLTGTINTYMQAASLVRVINAEIKMAKNTVKKFDELKNEAVQMQKSFRSLKEINAYDMDSWADWLERAENLTDWQSTSFMRLLSDGILTDLDTRLTKDFVKEVGRAKDYDISNGDAYSVLQHYYYAAEYKKRRKYLEETSLREAKTRRQIIEGQLLALNKQIEEINNLPDSKKKFREADLEELERQKQTLLSEAQMLSSQIASILYPTANDKQIDIMSQLNEEIFNEIPKFQDRLSRYNANLKKLLKEWEILVSNKLAKTQNRNFTVPEGNLNGLKSNSPNKYGDDKYQDPGDPTRADIALAPQMTSHRPEDVNTSNTESKTSLGDIQKLQNRIEYQKLLISQTGYNMELFLANIKAVYLSRLSYEHMEPIEDGKRVRFTANNLSNYFDAILAFKNNIPKGLESPSPIQVSQP